MRPNPAHHFVGDHHDTVFVAELAHALQVAIGRNEDAIGADDSFKNEGGDILRAFELNDFFDHGERSFGGIPAALDAVIGIEHADDAGDAGLGGPAAWLAGERHAAGGGAVIGTVAGHDLVASGEEAGELDGVFVGFCAAVGEEKSVDVAGSDFGELGAEPGARLGGHEGIGVASVSACSLIALMTRSSPCPMLTHMSWQLKSMKRLPSGVQK